MKKSISSGLKSAALGMIGGYVAKKALDKWGDKIPFVGNKKK